jgi:hypothetical protein
MRAGFRDVLEFAAGIALAWGVVISTYLLGFSLERYVSN